VHYVQNLQLLFTLSLYPRIGHRQSSWTGEAIGRGYLARLQPDRIYCSVFSSPRTRGPCIGSRPTKFEEFKELKELQNFPAVPVRLMPRIHLPSGCLASGREADHLHQLCASVQRLD